MEQPKADHAYGVWADSVSQLVTYRYLGCSSALIDRDHAVGRMRLRRDMRAPVGLLSAPVAIAMLDTAGINVDRRHHLALTQVDVHLYDDARDVVELRTDGRVVREARTQVFTEAVFRDARNDRRVLGHGTANWAVMGPTSDGFVYTDPGAGVADSPRLPPLASAYDAVPRAGGGYEIAGPSPRIGTEVLHHGPILVTLEATAFDLALREAGPPASLAIQTASTRIVRAGRCGPFVTTGEVLVHRDGQMVCRTEMVDVGAGSVLMASSAVRFRLHPELTQ